MERFRKGCNLVDLGGKPLCTKVKPSSSVFGLIVNAIYKIITFITISIPSFIFQILSYTFTFSISFPTIAVCSILGVIGLYFIIRYFFLTTYSRLPQQDAPPSKNDAFDLQPDASIQNENPINTFERLKTGFKGVNFSLDSEASSPLASPYPTDYLRSLLASIKIFGYLEEPIFNELARHLNTRRLLAGDSLIIDGDDSEKEKSFYIVIDGYVQVSAKHTSKGYFGDSVDEQINDNILLTEVKAGGTLSSLFTLLSLFTEKTQLFNTTNGNNFSHYLKDILNINHSSLSRAQRIEDFYNKNNSNELAVVKHSNHLLHSDSPTDIKRPKIVAKAMYDSTLAVIPAEAFHKLTQKFPTASAHIVQVIMTRFQRVTFLTLNKYLGMSKDLLSMEKKVTELANIESDGTIFKSEDVQVASKLARQIHKDMNENKEDIRASNTTGSANSNTAREVLTQSVIYLPESLFESKGMESTYAELRHQAYVCMVKVLGLCSNIQPVVSQAGDLSHVKKIDYVEISDSDDSDDDTQSTSTTSNPPTFSPGSWREDYEDEVKFFYFKNTTSIVNLGDRVDGLYLVVKGKIDVTIGSPDKPIIKRKSSVSLPNFGKENVLSQSRFYRKNKNTFTERFKQKQKKPFQVLPGCVAGYLGSLTGSPSFVNMVAGSDTLVAFLSSKYINRLSERYPSILLTLAKRLIYQLPPLLVHIDFALEWVQASSGKVLCRQGELCDSIYIVLNGRLRTIADSEEEGMNILGEYGQGDSVGELEVLTDSVCNFTLHAIRDSELARMPKSLFNALAVYNPSITIQISRMIALRTKEQQENLARQNVGSTVNQKTSFGKNNSNLKTVAIIPVRSHIPVLEFTHKLKSSFQDIGESVALLNSTAVNTALGKHAFTRLGKLKLTSWLVEQEESHRMVLLVADGGVNSPWTQRCIRQADCILLVGLGDDDPVVSEFERLLIGLKTTARKELVLLHSERTCVPGKTQAWLKNRLWIHAHHHVQFPLKRPVILANTPPLVTKMHQLRDQLSQYVADVSGISIDYKPTQQISSYTGIRSDYARLARRLLGKSIGLVLGGGGARGLAHIGFIQALEEAGIPIDIVGGCSIGAYIGGLYAKNADTVAIMGRAKIFSKRMASIWRKLADLTYPVISWFSGHEFNRGIWKSFFDVRIEDLWLPYYCVTTNITHSRLEIHQDGYLWRYVRASMSLSGFLPPLCDGENMLVDGGYLDYLPVSVMKSMGVDTIFALDVAGPEDVNSFTNYGDTLSGWYVILSRLNPFSSVRIPSLTDIQSRLAYVSSVSQLEAAKKVPGCIYIRLPVQSYGTLEFGSYQPIEQAGYLHGKKCLQTWDNEGLLDGWVKPGLSTQPSYSFSNSKLSPVSSTSFSINQRQRRNSF